MDDDFIKAYHDFRNSVDLTRSGVLPDPNNVAWYMLMGVPRVPADENPSEDSSCIAIEQRLAILKAVFVEVNRHENEVFLDKGLRMYDQAGRMAKSLLTDTTETST